MKNTLYGIGLDIGVASVGWAVVGLNGTGEPVGLHRLGVRIFDKAEQPKTGESLAAPLRSRRAPLGVSCTGGPGESGLRDLGGTDVEPWSRRERHPAILWFLTERSERNLALGEMESYHSIFPRALTSSSIFSARSASSFACSTQCLR